MIKILEPPQLCLKMVFPIIFGEISDNHYRSQITHYLFSVITSMMESSTGMIWGLEVQTKSIFYRNRNKGGDFRCRSISPSICSHSSSMCRSIISLNPAVLSTVFCSHKFFHKLFQLTDQLMKTNYCTVVP